MCIEFDIIVGGKYALGFLPGKGRGRNGREDARNKEIDFFLFDRSVDRNVENNGEGNWKGAEKGDRLGDSIASNYLL